MFCAKRRAKLATRGEAKAVISLLDLLMISIDYSMKIIFFGQILIQSKSTLLNGLGNILTFIYPQIGKIQYFHSKRDSVYTLKSQFSSEKLVGKMGENRNGI